MATTLHNCWFVLLRIHVVQHGPSKHEHRSPADAAAVCMELSDSGNSAEFFLLVRSAFSVVPVPLHLGAFIWSLARLYRPALTC